MATPCAAPIEKECQSTFRDKVTEVIDQAERLSHEAQRLATRANAGVEDGVRAARDATRRARDAALNAKTEAEDRVKREPFKTLSMAACAGAWVGLVFGFAAGRFGSR